MRHRPCICGTAVKQAAIVHHTCVDLAVITRCAEMSGVSRAWHLDMLLNEPPLEDIAVLGSDGILGHAAGDCAHRASIMYWAF